MPDLVGSDYANGQIEIALGQGPGSFGPLRYQATGNDPAGLAAADFDSDGKIDLAVGCIRRTFSGTSIAVLLGQGDGTFAPPSLYTVGMQPYEVQIGDFNGDHYPDIAAGNSDNMFSTGVSVLLGLGDGTFSTPTTTPTPTLFHLAVGDFNRDGISDVAAPIQDYTGQAHTVSVLLGSGNGGFGSLVPWETGPEYGGVATADFDGDGLLDLAIAAAPSKTGPAAVAILTGDGTGSFSAPIRNPPGGDVRSLAVGDFNGDGKPDLVGIGSDGTGQHFVWVYLNTSQ